MFRFKCHYILLELGGHLDNVIGEKVGSIEPADLLAYLGAGTFADTVITNLISHITDCQGRS